MLRSEKGQSLIEVLVVLVVATMMIVALITIILSSLKNAQFAQNQTQATKLGQDTVDKIRILRDNNANGTLTPSLGAGCFIELWNNSSGADFYCGGSGKFCYYDLISDGTLNYLGNTDTAIIAATNVNISGGFSRQIKVSQPDPLIATDYINLIVTISWTDSSGAHNSNIETILTKPDYDCI